MESNVIGLYCSLSVVLLPSTVGRGAIPVSGINKWNDLPPDVTSAPLLCLHTASQDISVQLFPISSCEKLNTEVELAIYDDCMFDSPAGGQRGAAELSISTLLYNHSANAVTRRTPTMLR